MPRYDVVWSAPLATSETVAVGTCVVNTGSTHVVATAANRATYGRATGIALTAGDANNPSVEFQTVGFIPASVSGLGAGAQSYVRVSSTGVLERCTPSGSDDVVGQCETNGDAHILFGTIPLGGYGTASSSSGSNLGAAPLQVFKDTLAGVLRHRTLRAGKGYLAGQQDPSGGTDEIWLRPSPIGHFNPHDYGAVGDGVTDDSTAFEAMLADVGTLIGAEVADSKSATILLAEQKTYYLSRELVLDRGYELRGVGGGGSLADLMSSRLKFAAGKGIWIRSLSGTLHPYGSGARIRNVAIDCTAVAGVGAWNYGATYNVGDLVYRPDDHEHVWECIKAGVSQPRPSFAPAWQAGHAYSPGDKVTPTIANGHIYTCVTGGTSDATEPLNWAFSPSQKMDGTQLTVTDNGVVWQEDTRASVGGATGQQPTSSHFIDTHWAWSSDQSMRPFVDANDPDVKRTTGHTYRYNQVIREAGVYDTAFWTADPFADHVAGATPLTSGAVGTTVSDGTTTWTRLHGQYYMAYDGLRAIISDATNASPIVITATAHGYTTGDKIFVDGIQGNTAANGRIWTITVDDANTFELTADENGTISTGNGAFAGNGVATRTNGADGVIWVPRHHPGIAALTQCVVEDVYITGSTCHALHARGAATIAPFGIADGFHFERVRGTSNHGFIRVRGDDCSEGTVINCQCFGNFDESHRHEWDRGFEDFGQFGSVWIGCLAQDVSGPNYICGSTTSVTIFQGCYIESPAQTAMLGGMIVGGWLAQASNFTIDTTCPIFRPGAGCLNVRGVDATGFASPGQQIVALLAGQINSSEAGKLALGVHYQGGAEFNAQGLTWGDAISFTVGDSGGWWAWCYGPGTYNGSFSTWAVTGEMGTALKDSDSATGQIFLGGRKGMLLWGDRLAPNALVAPSSFGGVLRTVAPASGKWRAADLVLDSAPFVGGYAGWICTVGDDTTVGTWARVAPVESGTCRSVDISGGNVTLVVADDYATVTVGGAHSVLLSASPVEGKWHSVKNRTGGAVTIDGNTKNIDGAATFSLADKNTLFVRYNATTGEWEIR